ncbi:hypothetical protein LIER_29947 [Lithospermum erythrorhizon]|uniref:TLDc domain-containing protein n=1 Tax=Lithospermum erythrorhizon TaxID=34254 RepID=A0AAV3RPL6_LITER
MGQTTSSSSSPEREAEALAASTGALPLLRKAFSILSDPQTQTIPTDSLQKCFELNPHNLINEETELPKDLPLSITHLAASILDLFFVGHLDWLHFLKAYTRCCGRHVASTSFNNLFRVFELAVEKAGIPAKLQFEEYDDNIKMNGSLLPSDVLMLIWICWMLSWDSYKIKSSYRKGDVALPDVSHLVLSVVQSCADGGDKLDPWDCTISTLDVHLPVAKIHSWALKTLPNLADCLSQFVRTRLCYFQNEQESCSSDCDTHSVAMSNMGLLTSGRAWALSLTLRGTMYEEISKLCFPIDLEISDEHLLYRSSIHGKGLNRFWSNVDGYNGPLLMLIAGYVENNLKRWVIGALTDQGFENKETFYGTSGVLYSISPTFHAFLSSGKEKNFVYSHLHTTIKKYEASPKPTGVAFGGSMGNERIYLDEDFAKVTLRHHAVDNTYQHGPLFPDQGYLPTEASVVEVEVWGLGGTRAHKFQSAYKKREDLFTEQRRKIDLKTFSNWEDSPEKMMMNMMSNPNTTRREDR